MNPCAAVGISRQADSQRAGMEAATEALSSLGGQADGLILFISDCYDPLAVLQGVRSITGSIPLIGSCATGIITPSGIHTDVVALMALRSDTLRVALATTEGAMDSPRLAGERLAETLLQRLPVNDTERPHAVVLVLEKFVSPLTAEVIQGATDVLGPLCPLIGGADGHHFRFMNDQLVSNELVAALLCSSRPIGIGVAHGWTPCMRPLIVTRSVGNIIYELDGQPAFEVYRQLWAQEAPGLTPERFPAFAAAHPFGLPQASGEYLIRDPYLVHPNGAIECAAVVPEHSVAHIMSGEKEALLAAAQAAAARAMDGLAGHPPVAAVIFDCISRLQYLREEAITEIENIRDVIGRETPLIGMFSYGEIAPPPDSGLTVLHNKTVAICVLA
ncbi:MAG: FIST C-terminal domain-containing protein [Anaerolineae bacterium]|nr:FIST C-terminal domain-containing protein [Anaerolineae bacterium]